MSRADKKAAKSATKPVASVETLTSDPLRVLQDLDRWMQGTGYASDHPWRVAVGHALKVAGLDDKMIPEGDLADFADKGDRKVARSWWGSLTSRSRVFWRGEGARETLAAAWKEFSHHARYWHAYEQSHATLKPENDPKHQREERQKLFIALQNIDAVSQQYGDSIEALVCAARKLVHCDASSLAALDELLELIRDRAELWVGSIEGDAEAFGAHVEGRPHLRLLGRLYDEQRALKEGGAA